MTAHIERANEWIQLQDGRQLSARIWLPSNIEEVPVPAILEYLPYRKRDGTVPRDDSTYPVFAEHGYAGVRVDIAGHGESDGIFDDEYSEQELNDGVEVINWIAQQSWCNGRVGMMGISWGGFNSLQIAALNPAPLKATIAIGTVVDRYNKDIHYKDGCQLYSNFSWANVMLCYASRPPDPVLRDDWKSVWLNRLKTQPWPLEIWLSHQRRDSYWEHGSVCEHFHGVKIPSMVISGWCDLYVDAPVAALENFPGQVKAINGPWIHKYPHFAWPKPRMDFHSEAITWWDRWLKDQKNDAEVLPDYRVFMAENTRPGKERLEEQGQWLAIDQWRAPPTEHKSLYPSQLGQLETKPCEGSLSVCSPQDCGTACGEVFTLKPDSELPGDQRYDDIGSLTFDTEHLDDALSFIGAPLVTLNVSINQRIGNIIARLVDVHPDGTGHRISWGVLNLCHRKNQQKPEYMTPDQLETVTIKLNHCAYKVLPGHQLRLALSTTYWPTITPPPHPVTATISLKNSRLDLPINRAAYPCEVPEPKNENPLPEHIEHKAAASKRWVEKDLQGQLTHYHVIDDTGEYEIPDHGLHTRHLRDECWSVSADDPLSAQASSAHTFWMSRDNWSIECRTTSSLTCDLTHYHLTATVHAFTGDELVHERHWKTSIKRDYT